MEVTVAVFHGPFMLSIRHLDDVHLKHRQQGPKAKKVVPELDVGFKIHKEQSEN